MGIKCDDHMRMLRKKECVQKEFPFYAPQRVYGNLIEVKREERLFGVFYVETRGPTCATLAPANVMDFAIRVIDRNNRQHNKFSVYHALANTAYTVPVSADFFMLPSGRGSTQSLQIGAETLQRDEDAPVDEFEGIGTAEGENWESRRDSFEANANEVGFPVLSSTNRKSRSPYSNYYGSDDSINTIKTDVSSGQSIGHWPELLGSQSSEELTSSAMLPMPRRQRSISLYSRLGLARDSSAIPLPPPRQTPPPRPLAIYLDSSQPLKSIVPITHPGFSNSNLQSSLELDKSETDATLPSPPSTLPCRSRCKSESQLHLKLLALSTGLTYIKQSSPATVSEIESSPGQYTPID